MPARPLRADHDPAPGREDPRRKAAQAVRGHRGGVLKAVSIRGDFFAHPEEGFDRAEASLIGIPASAFRQVFADAIEREGVELFGLSAGAVADVFEEMLHDLPPA
ncbi:MAG: hypothetical protein MZV64_09785 [Ignavibacteriales bacterium]|nr:hypothetical protein [Ignavibacteriales bacterium]